MMIYMHNKHDSPWTGNPIINQPTVFHGVWLTGSTHVKSGFRQVVLQGHLVGGSVWQGHCTSVGCLMFEVLCFEWTLTLPKTNIAPENGPSQKETSIPTIHFQVLC